MASFFISLFKMFLAILRSLWRFRFAMFLAALSFFVLSFPEQLAEIYANIFLSDSFIFGAVSLFATSLVAVFAIYSVTWLETHRRAGISTEVSSTKAVTLFDKAMLACAIGSPFAGLALGAHYARATLRTPTLNEAVEQAKRLDANSSPEISALMSSLVEHTELHQRAAAFLSLFSLVCLAVGVAVALVVFLAFLRPDLSRKWLGGSSLFHRTLLSPRRVYIAAACVFLAFSAFFSNLNPIAPFAAQLLGTPLLAITFLSLLTVFLSFCAWVLRNYDVPLLLLIAIYVTLLGLSGLTDNHDVELFGDPSSARLATSKGVFANETSLPERTQKCNFELGYKNLRRISLQCRFANWLNSRPQPVLSQYKGKRYPIFVVAAQGGGIYAANQSGIFLARLVDNCPAVLHHLFAVSSVSGGSLGLAAFRAALDERLEKAPEQLTTSSCMLTERTGQEPGALEKRVRAYLRNDFLSPLVAAQLFPDILQGLIFWPRPELDRARAFDASLSTFWGRGETPARPPEERNATTSNPRSQNTLNLDLRHSWKETGKAPMMVFNATMVDQGKIISFAPFQVETRLENGVLRRRWVSIYNGYLNWTYGVRVRSAVSLSARFPGFMPAGRIARKQGANTGWHPVPPSYRFVDGGYYDNSGIVAAGGMKRNIQAISQQGLANIAGVSGIDVHMIVLSGSDRKSTYDNARSEGLSEIASPWRAFVRSWQQTASDRVISAMENACPKCWVNEAHRYQLDDGEWISRSFLSHDYFSLPLGWVMSSASQEQIAFQIGRPQTCLSKNDLDDYRKQFIQKENNFYLLYSILSRNSCIYERIDQTLN